MSKDFADFLAALNSEGVAYVVIGGPDLKRLRVLRERQRD